MRIMDTPEDVAEACDLVFILASDGRLHPALFRAVAGRGKPVFVDKPFAVSASDAKEMFTLAAETGTRVFASSAFRYADGLVNCAEFDPASGRAGENMPRSVLVANSGNSRPVFLVWHSWS